MIESLKTSGAKRFFLLILVFLIAADLAILFNIPFLRQIIGFLFLTLLPGLLIFQILKLNKIEFTEKLVLTVGLSISFLMFFGLFINNLLPSLGYATPLSILSLLISFNIAFIVFTIIAYRTNKDKVFSLSNPNLTTPEKAFLIGPILFPALSIFGMHVMNTTNSNIILMFLLFLITFYVILICLFNQKFSRRLYPVVIFLISISLLLLLPLRSNHIIGMDTHIEYYFFLTTLSNLHWSIFEHSTLDACLAISLLPTIYQSILNISPEFLFRILYSLIYSISPLVIYIISKKYVGGVYAFLASCFFMFQASFWMTEAWARISIAILFFALAMMTLFNDKIDPLKKRILFIVFMASCMVSHYSTTYIFFFVMLGTFVGIEILSKKYTFKKVISLTIVILFFSMIFFWYSQVTETAFNAGVGFIEEALSNLNKFFVAESRTGQFESLFGQELAYPILSRVNFVVTWCTFIFIAIGVLTMLKRYKEMTIISIGNIKLKKPDFLKEKFEVAYSVIAVVVSGLLVMIVALPYISIGYDIHRSYPIAITILSTFFVIGGILLSKHFFFLQKTLLLRKSLYGKFASQKTCAKRKNNSFFGKAFFSKERFEGKNASQVRAYLIILLVLIPYFLFQSGVIYTIFGVPGVITLNSEGSLYDLYYVHDQQSYGAKWLGHYVESENLRIYTDHPGANELISQGGISFSIVNRDALVDQDIEIKGYIYLRYYNVVNGKLLDRQGEEHDMMQYSDKFAGKCKVYNNGGAEIWR